MCRPSCCKPRSQAPGIAAVALIIGAGIAATKIRPEAHRILYVAVDVLRTSAVIIAVTAAVAMVAWVLTQAVRWWLRHRNACPAPGVPAAVTAWSPASPVTGQRPCLACGGHGEVLRCDGAGQFEPRACPECKPARLAG
jgi:hypothetical protein